VTTLERGDDLRALVREVLRDALPSHLKAKASAKQLPDVTEELPSREETVILDNDADLNVFARRLAEHCEDPARRRDLQNGLFHFQISRSVTDLETQPIQKIIRVERGAATERQVNEASRQGARLVLSRSAVLTPLARDRARTLSVDVEREK
jgi:hypothetical protein